MHHSTQASCQTPRTPNNGNITKLEDRRIHGSCLLSDFTGRSQFFSSVVTRRPPASSSSESGYSKTLLRTFARRGSALRMWRTVENSSKPESTPLYSKRISVAYL